jgi:hypothetical protein
MQMTTAPSSNRILTVPVFSGRTIKLKERLAMKITHLFPAIAAGLLAIVLAIFANTRSPSRVLTLGSDAPSVSLVATTID